MLMSPPRNIKEVQASKLGDDQGIPFFINQNIRSFLNTIYFYCFIYYVLFLERLLFLFPVCLVFFAVINSCILEFLCGKETCSSFSCEYSYSQPYLFEYSFLASSFLSHYYRKAYARRIYFVFEAHTECASNAKPRIYGLCEAHLICAACTDSVLPPKKYFSQPERRIELKRFVHIPQIVIKLSLVLHFLI